MSEWTRQGECNHCGYCCLFLATQAHMLALEKDGFRDQHGKFDEQHLKVRHVMTDQAEPSKVVTHAWFYSPCSEFKVDELRCGIQETKPYTCSAYPWDPEQVIGTPCSYFFEKKQDDTTLRIGGQGSPYPGHTGERAGVVFQDTQPYINAPYPLIMPRSTQGTGISTMSPGE